MKKDECSVADKTDRSAVMSVIIKLLLSLAVAVLLLVFIAVVFGTDYDGGAKSLADLINDVQ